MTQLKGITWDHPRGYHGLRIASEAFSKIRPDISITWDVHSLHAFESHPISDLAARYDLMVIDHPSMGEAFKEACLVDLSQYAEELELAALAADSAGPSFETYRYRGGLWALPLDAACQTAVARPDLIEAYGPVPTTLGEMKERIPRGKAAMGLRGVHAVNAFWTICANLGEPPFSLPERVISEETGLAALEALREIYDLCPPEAVDWNSIECLEAMSERDDLVYAPYVYNYSTYSQRERQPRLTFHDIPGVREATPKGAVIGGTGLAISVKSPHRKAALDLAHFLLSRPAQKGMALQLGQPGRKSVWLDDDVNDAYSNFYRQTLATIEQSYQRPRYPGFLAYQQEAGRAVEGFLREKKDPKAALREIQALHEKYYTPGVAI